MGNLFESAQNAAASAGVSAAVGGAASAIEAAVREIEMVRAGGMLGVPYAIARKYFPDANKRTPEEWQKFVFEKNQSTPMDLINMPEGELLYLYGNDGLAQVKDYRLALEKQRQLTSGENDALNYNTRIEVGKALSGLQAEANKIWAGEGTNLQKSVAIARLYKSAAAASRGMGSQSTNQFLTILDREMANKGQPGAPEGQIAAFLAEGDQQTYQRAVSNAITDYGLAPVLQAAGINPAAVTSGDLDMLIREGKISYANVLDLKQKITNEYHSLTAAKAGYQTMSNVSPEKARFLGPNPDEELAKAKSILYGAEVGGGATQATNSAIPLNQRTLTTEEKNAQTFESVKQNVGKAAKAAYRLGLNTTPSTIAAQAIVKKTQEKGKPPAKKEKGKNFWQYLSDEAKEKKPVESTVSELSRVLNGPKKVDKKK